MKRTNLITPEVLRKIDRANKMCHDLHIPAPPIQFIKVEVVDDLTGEVVEEFQSKSNSWVRNAYNMLAQMFLPIDSIQGGATFGAGSQSGKGINGTTYRYAGRYMAAPAYTLSGYAFNASADSTFGILVGTSDTAESFEHTALQAQIAHGTASGQLAYGAMAIPTATYDSGTKKWSAAWVRNFSNNSGASITVKEVGMAYNWYAGTSTVTPVLVSRDVLASPIAVANGQTLRVTYTSEITYPS